MTNIQKFYLGYITLHGKNIYEILSMSNEDWEKCHDFIQWVYPLPEPSQFNINAPLLKQEDITFFKEEILSNIDINTVLVSIAKFLSYIGIMYNNNGEFIICNEKPRFKTFSHNSLRITRFLKWLTLIGRNELAKNLYDFLERYSCTIPSKTLEYWKNATLTE